MKKVILISLIILFVWIPVSLDIDTNSSSFILLEAHAQSGPNIINTSAPLATGDNSSFFAQALTWIVIKLSWVPITITGYLVQMSAMLLNLSIETTIVGFGEIFNSLAGISTAWETLRDLANIFFIFGLLSIAIATILGLQGYGYKKLLATLIVVALIINFSLFFTKFVIDTSNIFALQFYSAVSAPGSDGTTGIANTFIRDLGIASVWDTGGIIQGFSSANNGNDWGTFLTTVTFAVFTSIFFLVTAFVFMFAAIMLTTRAVGFILLAILSPLAFASYILPGTRKWAQTWWHKLWQYAIFAPALLILFWVVASIIPDISANIGKDGQLLGGLAGGAQKTTPAVGAILNFIILITLMLASIIISNKLSIEGAKGAGKLAGKITLGLPAFAGRQTLGRGFSRISQSEGLKGVASGEKTVFGGRITRNLAQLTLGATRAGASGSLDVRGAPGVAGFAKDVAKVDLGKPQQGGYEAILKKQTEDREKFGKSLAPSAATTAAADSRLENLTKAKAILAKEKELVELREEKGERVAERVGEIEKDLEGLRAEASKANPERVAEVEKEIKYLKGAGDLRRESRAKTLESEKTIDTMFMKVPRKNKEGATSLRKKDLALNKAIKEMIKKEVSKKEKKAEEDKKEESEDKA